MYLLALSGALAGSACGHAPDRHEATTPEPVAEATPSWSPQARVPGEYLVTLAGGADAKALTDTYGRFGINRIMNLGNSVFQLNLSEDPGPEKMEALRREDGRIKAVQPNFSYRVNRPAGQAR